MRQILYPFAGTWIAELTELNTCESLEKLSALILSSIARSAKKHATDLANLRADKAKKVDDKVRQSNFHSVQIACDLYTLGLVKLDDNGADCPLAIGSSAGIKHVHRWEDKKATIKSLAEQTGREPHEVQTSLCEYNKYVKWWNGAEKYKPR